MATQKQTLKPASELARAKPAHYPNESAEYRAARTALLGEGPDMNPLWIILDTTPEGRGTDWYPKLDYGDAA